MCLCVLAKAVAVVWRSSALLAAARLRQTERLNFAVGFILAA